MKRTNQRGSHVIALVLFIAVLGVIGITGYKVWRMRGTSVADNAPAATSVKAPEAINTQADLTQAAKALDAAAAQLNASLNDAALNTDMQSML